MAPRTRGRQFDRSHAGSTPVKRGTNMKLGLKLLAAPVLTAVVLTVVAQVNAFMITQEAGKSQASSNASLDEFKTVASVQQQLGLVHAGVYKTVALIGSLDDAKVKAFRADLAKQLAGVKKVSATLAASAGTGAAYGGAIEAIGAQVDKYGKQADSAIDLASVDPNTGIAAMQGADATFSGLTKQMADVVARSEDAAQAANAAATQRARNTNLALAIVGLGVAGLMVWLSWLTQRKVVQELDRAATMANQVASGNLTRSATSARQDEVGDLVRALGSMTTQLNTSIATVMSSSESIRLASAEIATGNQDLANRTEQTATNLQRAAASTEQLTGTVRQSAESAQQANHLARTACEVAVRGGAVVGQVVSTMEEINTSSRKISDIISVIDGIAFQTNILALNAAVEAARAGEQGRGFAVVASEVRSLAGRSAEAAREIKGLIGSSVERVEAGTRLVADAGKTMTEIVNSVQRVSDIIGEISSTSSGQSDGIAQVNHAVLELDQMTQQNAALVEQSAAAAESLREQAQRLAQVVSSFRLADSQQGQAPLMLAR